MTTVAKERVTALACTEKTKAIAVPVPTTVVTRLGHVAAVVAAGTQGPPGKAGEIGPAGGTAFERRAGETLSALKAVWEDDTGAVWPLDYRDELHIDLLAGITITAATAGAEITVQRSGPLNADGLNLAPGRVWLGANGTLTQTPPADGYDVLIGYATADQRIYLDLNDNIKLTEE